MDLSREWFETSWHDGWSSQSEHSEAEDAMSFMIHPWKLHPVTSVVFLVAEDSLIHMRGDYTRVGIPRGKDPQGYLRGWLLQLGNQIAKQGSQPLLAKVVKTSSEFDLILAAGS